MKVYHYTNGNERMKRELQFYDSLPESIGIPRIINRAQYRNDLIVFEEFIEGDDLSDICDRYVKNNEMITPLIHQVCSIMQPHWEKGYVHRDIKPGNIRIKPDGSPVILDFGILFDPSQDSITITDKQPHTWDYAAPEQYAGKRELISYRTDFFSVGILAYYLFHQTLPFGSCQEEIRVQFTSSNVIVECSESFLLGAFCTETLKISPTERPRTVEDLFHLIAIRQ